MKFKLVYMSLGVERTETYDSDGINSKDEATEYCKNIIERFNETLRPGENPREFVRMECDTKFPHIKVALIGEDGNAFAIIGKVKNALKDAKVPAQEVKEFQDKAMSSDYDNLLRTVSEYVTIISSFAEPDEEDDDGSGMDTEQCDECGEDWHHDDLVNGVCPDCQ